METNKIYQGECMDLLKELKDEEVDCIIIDPPYSGLQAKSRGDRFSQAEHHIDYDDMSERAFLLFIKPIFRELYRVAKVGSHFYCFTDWKQLRNMADCIELASFKIVNIVCWDKGHFGTGAGYRSQTEYILVFSKGLPNIFNLRNIGNVIKCKRANNGFHPHEKPLELIKTFISNSTKEGELVLDCFLGSGTTAVGCKELNRRYIGFEIDKNFCDIANQRLTQNSLTKTEVGIPPKPNLGILPTII
jgi:site-specific DNA-methyltransferase (adenine-specific)